ncbi:hypothetical protein CF326_g7046 [Tilletia indica]|nr:hypothetical protein CF326_g7046 [Tilletia indica]
MRSSSSADPPATKPSVPPCPSFCTPSRSSTQPAGVSRQLEQLYFHLFKPLEGKGVFKHTPVMNGALLFGPPGTGKTMMVAYAASKARIKCITLKASEIHNKYYGESEKMLASVFADAKANAPAVVLIDEIDCVFPSRDSDSTGASHVAMLSQLLTELDGVRDKRVALIATTNRKTSIDPALLRRLAVHIEVPLPDSAARKDIILQHLLYLKESRRVKHQLEDAQIQSLALKTSGCSGSDLVTVIDRAVLSLAHHVHSSPVPKGQRRLTTLPPLRLRNIVLPDHASGKLHNRRGRRAKQQVLVKPSLLSLQGAFSR